MNTEWMPENPCSFCDNGIKHNDNYPQSEHYYDMDGDCCCSVLKEYRFGVYYQTKLLKWFIDNPPKGAIYPYQYEAGMREMLKQLEGNQDE